MKTETQIREEIEALRNLSTAQLKEKYREAFGEESRSNHKQFLFRRIAWRIQANAWGGLSERARRQRLLPLRLPHLLERHPQPLLHPIRVLPQRFPDPLFPAALPCVIPVSGHDLLLAPLGGPLV
ncbi:MAG: DUF2924 domain-containing protein [Bryobacteraceae bacterium]